MNPPDVPERTVDTPQPTVGLPFVGGAGGETGGGTPASQSPATPISADPQTTRLDELKLLRNRDGKVDVVASLSAMALGIIGQQIGSPGLGAAAAGFLQGFAGGIAENRALVDDRIKEEHAQIGAITDNVRNAINTSQFESARAMVRDNADRFDTGVVSGWMTDIDNAEERKRRSDQANTENIRAFAANEVQGVLDSMARDSNTTSEDMMTVINENRERLGPLHSAGMESFAKSLDDARIRGVAQALDGADNINDFNIQLAVNEDLINEISKNHPAMWQSIVNKKSRLDLEASLDFEISIQDKMKRDLTLAASLFSSGKKRDAARISLGLKVPNEGFETEEAEQEFKEKIDEEMKRQEDFTDSQILTEMGLRWMSSHALDFDTNLQMRNFWDTELRPQLEHILSSGRISPVERRASQIYLSAVEQITADSTDQDFIDILATIELARHSGSGLDTDPKSWDRAIELIEKERAQHKNNVDARNISKLSPKAQVLMSDAGFAPE